MDQNIINWIVALVGFLGGWILKVVWDAVKELRSDLRQIEKDLPDIYVRKDDFREIVKEIKTDMREGFKGINDTLGLIFKKLDSKEDK